MSRRNNTVGRVGGGGNRGASKNDFGQMAVY